MSKLAQVFSTLEIVVAVADNGVIGRDQGLPWRQRTDLRRFKALTLGHSVLMGRRTFESLGRPLPGRRNLVLSQRVPAADAALTWVTSLDEARRQGGEGERLFVIGGSAVYALALAEATVLHLTEVHARPAGDVSFPPWNRDDWVEVGREAHPADPENDHPYSFVTLTRRQAP